MHDDGASAPLVLTDPQAVADLRTYVSRARAADDGGIRLAATGPVLAAYVCMLQPKMLGESTPTILGLRTMALVEPARLDVTVPLAAVSDRLARMGDTGVELSVPPMTLNQSWSGISAPRGGWQQVADLSSAQLIEVARNGVREVAEIVPVNPGALIVNNARGAVWGRLMEGMETPVPAGAAFAAYALGFLTPGHNVQLFAHERWLRLSSSGGHVLVRPPAIL